MREESHTHEGDVATPMREVGHMYNHRPSTKPSNEIAALLRSLFYSGWSSHDHQEILLYIHLMMMMALPHELMN